MEVIERIETEVDNRRDILITELCQNIYECMVCFEKILCIEPIWHCGRCYSIFHSICIHKWALSSSAARGDAGPDIIGGNKWRCPGCQGQKNEIPESIGRCFCGGGGVGSPEMTNQRPDNMVPHSCGQICNSARSDAHCSHPCPILCHPGPCPKCQIQVNRFCLCGKIVVTVECGASNPDFQCDHMCQAILPCGKHRCIRSCHTKPCGECPFDIKLDCHCGKESKDSPCGRGNSGKYSCQRPCEKWAHCKTTCHPGPCSGGYSGRMLSRIESSSVGLPQRNNNDTQSRGPPDIFFWIFCYFPISLFIQTPVSSIIIGMGFIYLNDCPEQGALCPVMILLGTFTIIGKILKQWVKSKKKNPGDEIHEITPTPNNDYSVMDLLTIIIIVIRVGLYVYLCFLVISLNLNERKGTNLSCNSNLLLMLNCLLIITFYIGICSIFIRSCLNSLY